MSADSEVETITHSVATSDRVSRLRILAISDVFPWPTRDGYRLRFASVLSGLASLGEIDLFVCAYPGEESVQQLPGFVGRCRVIRVPFQDRSLRYLAHVVSSPLPHRIVQRRWNEAEGELQAFARPPYDVVWFSHAGSYAAFGHLGLGPAVVDLDNLEDHVIARSKRPTGRPYRTLDTGAGAIRRLLREIRDSREQWCWARLQRKIVERASVVSVCSRIDRDRLAGDNVAVVPNGYLDPGPDDGCLPREPVLLMIARFTYEPNLVGARWFVNEVLPRLRDWVPGVQLRLVGRHDKRMGTLENIPNVQIVGEVAHVGSEVRSARAVVVPLMTGGGTRLKILEALAYGRPVITTSVGVEGLDLEPGNEALVADDVGGFAESCRDVLVDEGLARRIGEAGRSFFLKGYQLHHVHESVTNLVTAMSTSKT